MIFLLHNFIQENEIHRVRSMHCLLPKKGQRFSLSISNNFVKMLTLPRLSQQQHRWSILLFLFFLLCGKVQVWTKEDDFWFWGLVVTFKKKLTAPRSHDTFMYSTVYNWNDDYLLDCESDQGKIQVMIGNSLRSGCTRWQLSPCRTYIYMYMY